MQRQYNGSTCRRVRYTEMLAPVPAASVVSSSRLKVTVDPTAVFLQRQQGMERMELDWRQGCSRIVRSAQ